MKTVSSRRKTPKFSEESKKETTSKTKLLENLSGKLGRKRSDPGWQQTPREEGGGNQRRTNRGKVVRGRSSEKTESGRVYVVYPKHNEKRFVLRESTTSGL